MKTGAEDAARDYGVTLEVFGDASFDTPTHQAFFETALQRGFDGIAVVTNPGDQWITPIQQAADQGVPMVGANVTGLETALTTWVGQDEYNSGVILGDEMLKAARSSRDRRRARSRLARALPRRRCSRIATPASARRWRDAASRFWRRRKS